MPKPHHPSNRTTEAGQSDSWEGSPSLEDLRAAHSRLEATLSALPDFLFEVDTTGRILDYRTPDPDKLYLPPEVFLGRKVEQVIPPPGCDTILEAIQEATEAGQHRGAIYCLELDGEEVWFELSIARKPPWEGKDKRLIVLARDITKRKKAEQALLQMALGVSHNFNNALMAILGNAQAAQNALEKPEPDRELALELLENVVHSAEGGRDVVQRILRYASGRRGAISKTEPLDLARLLEEVKEIALHTWPRFRQGELTLELETGPGLVVRGIRGELREVLLNLIKNAVEAIPGRGRIRIQGRRQGDEVVIRVQDDGQGLEPITRRRIFRPFYTTKGGTDMGLGLTISRTIVRDHQGELELEERPGPGACFRIRLPHCPLTPAREQRPRRPAPPQRVLLVEDESLVALGLESILCQAGHQVRVAGSLADALEALEEFDPSLVICDLGLPDGSGWEVMARLQQSKGLNAPPVMVLTGWSSVQGSSPPPGLPQPAAF